MSNQVSLTADVRTEKGKKSAKRLRNQGQLPAVVYGENGAPVNCSVDERALVDLLHEHGRNAIINLNAGDQDQSTIIKDIQHHPLRGDILHVDFHRIDLTRKIVVEVAVSAQGNPVGVRNDGGILEHMLHYIEIECLPTDIPDHIDIDVSDLAVGDSLHVSDITLGNDALEIITEGDRTVFSVAAPTIVAVDEETDEDAELAAEDAEMQEPEVIERGKRDEDEDEDA